MTSARLRITHADTEAEYVYGDVVLSDDALVSRTSVSVDGAVEVGGVTLVVTDASILGATAKPIPAGRHRAVVERYVGAAWEVVATGTVSNERTSCGSTYAPPASGPHAGATVRRWTIELADTALVDALEALAEVQLADVATGLSVSTAVALGGGTIETGDRLWFDVIDALDDAATEAALTLEAPATAISEPTGALAVASPHPDRAGSCPAWSGADLLEWWRALTPLLVSASYAAYPSADVTLTIAAAPLPADYVTGSLVDLDDVDGDRAWEQADWTTEPAATDGEVYDDLGLTYEGGPDGSRIDSAGVLDVPLAATYAAAQPRLSGSQAAARDGGRESANDAVLELPTRLPGHEAASLATASDGAGGEIDMARPAIDVAAGVDVVYAAVLVDVSGSLRSVVERRPSGGSATMELWAESLYPGISTRYADRDALRLDVPLDLVDGVGVGDVSVEAEGLAWSAASVDRDHDHATASLTLVRPTSLAPVAPPSGSGRYEPAPYVTAVSDDSGLPSVDVDAVVVRWAEVPASIEIEHVSGEPAASVQGAPEPVLSDDALSPDGRHWRLEAEVASGTDSYAGSVWRARALYASGTISAWVEATAAAAP